jgi:hypothetical protein
MAFSCHCQWYYLGELPEAAERQKKDIKFHFEWFVWNTSLMLFAVALMDLIASLVLGSVIWAPVRCSG